MKQRVSNGASADVLLISNTSWSVYNFRRGVIEAIVRSGRSVVVAAPLDNYSERIAKLGCQYVPLPMDNMGRNPFRDAKLYLAIKSLIVRTRPQVLLTFTPKPNIYGAFAAQSTGVPVLANVAGLGSIFGGRSLTRYLVEVLYRCAFRSVYTVFFQNEDDLRLFVSKSLVDPPKTRLLPGSGVDTTRFQPRENLADGVFRFLFLGRLLREKGVEEYVSAARFLMKRYRRVKFQILGFLDARNPSAISQTEMKSWVDEGFIEYLGETDDVRQAIGGADCVVLPSYYREGVPRSLLEAASMAKPIITTDMPGCRRAVVDGVTGYFVRPKDIADLVHVMEKMLLLSEEERKTMGKRGRERMVKEFDEGIVIGEYLTAIGNLRSRGLRAA